MRDEQFETMKKTRHFPGTSPGPWKHVKGLHGDAGSWIVLDEEMA